MFKRIIALFLTGIMFFAVVGCKKNDEESAEVSSEEQATKLEEYKGMILDLLDALVKEDFDKVNSLCYSAGSVSIKTYCEQCEVDYEFDFKDGYEFKKYYNAYSVPSESDVEGTIYLYDVRVNFGDSECIVSVQILDDGKKVGIVKFEISPRML
ncbi:MAG: hypothetical protein IKM46_04985 [Clostridia bacterium]|nr:hypothetical protein [Clostridia bacterium]